MDRLLTTREVAKLFGVDAKTVTRWAVTGRISYIRTPGGHRRFRASVVRALLAGATTNLGRTGEVGNLGRSAEVGRATAASPLSDRLPAGVTGAPIGTRGGAR